jgi:choline kinase
VLATGYREEAVREAVSPLGVATEYCRNSEYANTQNSVSLACCASAIRDEPIIKLDGDLVLDIEIIRRVLSVSSPMLVAVDSARELDQEAMKVEVGENGLIRRFGKSLVLSASSAESIGIEVLDGSSNNTILRRIETLMSQGITDRYYEDVYSELIQDSNLSAKALDVAGLGWTEVDTFDDLERARQLVASSIE